LLFGRREKRRVKRKSKRGGLLKNLLILNGNQQKRGLLKIFIGYTQI
jgi:hypothetical protein